MYFWEEATEILKRCKVDYIESNNGDDQQQNTPGINIKGHQLSGYSKGNRINFYLVAKSPAPHFSEDNLSTTERKELENLEPPYFHDKLKDNNFAKGLNLWLAFIPKKEAILKQCFDRVEAQAAAKYKILDAFKDFGLAPNCNHNNNKYDTSAIHSRYNPDIKTDFSFYTDKPAMIRSLELNQLTIEEGINILSLLFAMREIKPQEATP